MADKTEIGWTDATWQPVTGCRVVTPGCTNCYAMKLAGTRLQHHPSRAGLTRDSRSGPVWTGEVRFNEKWIDQPLRWKRPRRIFVCAHGDLFAEGVPDEWIDQVFAVMALASQHTFQVLTKRADRMRAYMNDIHGDEDRCRDIIEASRKAGALLGDLPLLRDSLVKLPLPNVWLGVSVEDQARADQRIPDLLATPAAVRFASVEPMLGPVNLLITDARGHDISALRGIACDPTDPEMADDYYRTEKLDWIICGGESGPGARPMHPDWARSLRDQCAAAGVPFFFKQWGRWFPAPDRNPATFEGLMRLDGYRASHQEHQRQRLSREISQEWQPLLMAGKKTAGRLLDGALHDGMPA
ncbi:DUF5131 family protein [Seohaeicola nanhaiensis]|uniref:DUF5131 family protein n=1 Tax=Seohaeicola nanhaiensis TaxID=1387282 RepID=A0ABV9KEE7_9RHOB